MKPAKSPGHDAARKRLLEEGARSYLEANTALLEYQREVQAKCRGVMETYIEDYGSALKVPLKSRDNRPLAWPKSEAMDGTVCTLGVQIVRKNIPPGIRWWDTFCGLTWESENAALYCWVGEGFWPTKMAAHLFQKFRRLDPKVVDNSGDPNNVWIQDNLEVTEGATFDEKLEGLFEQWIKLWKKVGGMKEVFKA